MSKKKKIIPLPQLAPQVLAVDSHCHLDMADYDDCQAVVGRAAAAGVSVILSIGIDLPSSRAALALALEYSGVFCAVGIHPHHVALADESHYQALAELAREPRVKAYGEIGLDYAKSEVPRGTQIRHFERQVALAQELRLPMIIHDREAYDDVLAVLRAAGPLTAGGVMHCFSGDMTLAEAAMAMGFLLSIPGVVTFPKAETLHEVARALPLEALLIESDGPYLTPEPFRGKRNEPAYVLYTAAKIAALRGISLDEVVRQTTANAVKLFALEGRS